MKRSKITEERQERQAMQSDRIVRPGATRCLLLVGDVVLQLKRLPAESIDMCITSPPYWALRDYGVEGQLGLEPTFKEYIEKLCCVFDEIKRVLKKEGTCWVNLGDTYGGSNCGYGQTETSSGFQNVKRQPYYATSKNRPLAAKVMPKCLLMIPFRFAIEMVNRGWILRNTIIWHKPNCVPSSVKDRFTVDFEYIFFFSKNGKYNFEKQYEPWGKDKRESGIARARKYGYQGKGTYQDWYFNKRKKQSWVDHENDLGKGFGHQCRGQSSRKPPLIHPFGRNKRCVWAIPTKPFKDAHFATYPPELIETPIRAGCPQDGIVLDPFSGSGTTAEVALRLGRRAIGIDLNPEYIKMSKRRLESFLKEKEICIRGMSENGRLSS